VTDDRLRILGIADVGASHTQKWANYLARRGHHVHLVSYAAFGEEARTPLHEAVSVAPWILPPFHVKRPWITSSTVVRLRRAVLAHRTDLVQVHFLGPGAWYAALAGGAPLALWVMGGGDVRGTSWQPASLRERLLSPLALRRATLVTAWSRNLQAIVRPMVRPGVPCEVVVGGVDTRLFRRSPDRAEWRARLGLEPDDFAVLSCRLLWPRQNALTLVRALPLIREHCPQARLRIVDYRGGDAPEYLRLVEREIERLSLTACVKLVPSLPNDQMPAYLSAADCVASIPDTDGTPMTVMEAFACGTPCVVHDLKDYDPDLFQDGRTVLRVPLRDPQGLADAVVRLIREPALRATLVRNGRVTVEQRASYEGEMHRLEGLYRQVLSTGR
jgi:glycosyltransferase involved in cell wall biosynthesis